MSFFPPLVRVIVLSVGLLGLALFADGQNAAAQESLANIIEQSEKSVVRIEVKGIEGDSLGSGFVVSKDGMLVTNVHVLAGAQKARAIFPNGNSYEIVGTLHIDANRDICVAKMNVENMTPILLADGLPRKGEPVTALGSPMGLSFTATRGIVSAIRPGEELGRDVGQAKMEGTWVQVDAALSGGNSGGPLINSKGEVVAMSTLASQGEAHNLNFGISITDIRAAVSLAKNASLKTLTDGVGRVKDHEVASNSADGSMLKRRNVPERSLQRYIEEGRESFRDLARNVRRDTTAAEKMYRTMKKGGEFIPAQYRRKEDDAVIRVSGRTSVKYYFRSEAVKRRLVAKKEDRMKDLKKLKSLLAESTQEESLLPMLKQAGPRLDPQALHSVGFMDGAKVLHAFNDHDVLLVFDEVPFLMWVESSSGLSLGQELSASPVFVAGTETMKLPDGQSRSLTVLQVVSNDQLSIAFGETDTPEEFLNWVAGKHSIEAKLLSFDGKTVLLKKRDGTEIEVPFARLDSASQAAAKK